MYNYRMKIVRWIDGDTVDGMVDLGFGIYTKIRFRLLELDTPERAEPNYVKARECANSVHPPGSDVEIKVLKGTDKYGRWLVSLPLVNEALTKSKLLKADNASSNL